MKDQFIELYKSYITRPGADKLLEWLTSSDFFTAPASTRFHLSRPGGLCEHSIHVYYRLRELYVAEKDRTHEFPELTPEEEETIAICGLLHDICKVNYYGVEMRNRKNEQGRWEKYPFYIVEDKLPYGHGEKSVYIAAAYMRLTREEAMAIRWHMGAFSGSDSKDLGNAFEMFPLALLTHLADMMATYIDEKDSGGNA